MKDQNDIIIFALEAVCKISPGDILKFSELAEHSEFEESQIEEAYRHLTDGNLISGTELPKVYAINNPSITEKGMKKLQDLRELKGVLG